MKQSLLLATILMATTTASFAQCGSSCGGNADETIGEPIRQTPVVEMQDGYVGNNGGDDLLTLVGMSEIDITGIANETENEIHRAEVLKHTNGEDPTLSREEIERRYAEAFSKGVGQVEQVFYLGEDGEGCMRAAVKLVRDLDEDPLKEKLGHIVMNYKQCPDGTFFDLGASPENEVPEFLQQFKAQVIKQCRENEKVQTTSEEGYVFRCEPLDFPPSMTQEEIAGLPQKALLVTHEEKFVEWTFL